MIVAAIHTAAIVTISSPGALSSAGMLDQIEDTNPRVADCTNETQHGSHFE